MENWGLLQKSQVDPETIEQAIARLIEAHNADETAHLGVGQSLQSHAASEVIDHLADSIISDKILREQIGPEHINNDKIVIRPTFNSIDAWIQSKVGIGADIIPQVGSVTLICGNATGNVTSISLPLNDYINVDPGMNPFIDCKSVFNSSELSDHRLTCMAGNPFEATAKCFGFEKLKNDTDVYCFYIKSATKYRTSVGVIADNEFHRYRAECIITPGTATVTLNFYVDGVFVHTYVVTSFAQTSYFACSFGVKKQTTDSATADLVVCDLLYSQLWPY